MRTSSKAFALAGGTLGLGWAMFAHHAFVHSGSGHDHGAAPFDYSEVSTTVPFQTIPDIDPEDLGPVWIPERDCPSTGLRIEISGNGWRVLGPANEVVAGPKQLDNGEVPDGVIAGFCPPIEEYPQGDPVDG